MGRVLTFRDFFFSKNHPSWTYDAVHKLIKNSFPEAKKPSTMQALEIFNAYVLNTLHPLGFTDRYCFVPSLRHNQTHHPKECTGSPGFSE
jgi:hypothetical protein